MNNELVTQGNSEITIQDMPYDHNHLSSDDILMSKYLVMQPLSKLKAKNRKLQDGDIVDSVTESVICKVDESVEVVILSFLKTWVLSENVKGKFEYRGVEPFTPRTALLPKEFMQNGVAWKRTVCANFAVLLASEIARAIKENDVLTPATISFQGTAFYNAKKLLTSIANNNRRKLPIFSDVFHLKTVEKQNEKGRWYVFDVDMARKATDGEIKVADDCASFFNAAPNALASVASEE